MCFPYLTAITIPTVVSSTFARCIINLLFFVPFESEKRKKKWGKKLGSIWRIRDRPHLASAIKRLVLSTGALS